MKCPALLAVALCLTVPASLAAQGSRFVVRDGAPPAPAPRVARADHVLVVSIDGLSWRAFRRHRWHMPRLRALARRGSARPLRVTFPSMTWTAHTSLLTGQYPRVHGVLGNRWYEGGSDIARPYREADVASALRARTPTIVDLVANAGGVVGALNWPMTQGAKNIEYNLPEFMLTDTLPWTTASPALQKLLKTRYRRESRGHRRSPDHLPQLVGRVLEREGLESDLLVRQLAGDLVAPPAWLRRAGAPKAPPKLLLVHFLLLDTWLHRYGNAPFVERWAVAEMDRMLGAVLAAYRRAKVLRRTAIFVVSDHGFAEISHTFDLRRALHRRIYSSSSRRLPLAQRPFVAVYNGHVAYLYLRQTSDQQRIKALLMERGYKRCVESIYSPKDYPQLGLPQRAAQGGIPAHRGSPDLVVMTRPTCTFDNSRNGQLITSLGARPFGHHGYLPTHRALAGMLVAAGAGLRRLRPRALSRAEVVDIAPTIAQLLALRWPKRFPGAKGGRFTLDGRVLSGLLSEASKPSAQKGRKR